MRTWLTSVVVSCRSSGWRGGSLKGRVDSRGILELLAGRAWRVDAGREGWFVGHAGDGCVGTAEHLGLISVGVGRGSRRAHRRGRAWSWLDGSRAGSLLEDWVVAQTLALGFLAIAAGWMLFVALGGVSKIWREQTSPRSGPGMREGWRSSRPRICRGEQESKASALVVSGLGSKNSCAFAYT